MGVRQSYHVSVDIQRALEELRDGNNVLECTPMQAWNILVKARNEGKKFLSPGCDKMNHAGRCRGHRQYLDQKRG